LQIEQPPSAKPYDKPEGERRGLVIVNTGDGKGKSTAAFGLALRAHGRGKPVKIFQFMKVPTARFGEHRAFEILAEERDRTAPGRPKPAAAPSGGSDDAQRGAWGPMIEGLGDGFSWKSQDLERSAQLARDGWERARAAILSGEFFLVVLDELTYPLIYGWLPLDGVLQTLRERPREVHVCITGRRCPPEIVELADTVTEMQKVKHAFNAGVPAQRGIED
jgi:cob(I)alamin adenosyltransferase